MTQSTQKLPFWEQLGLPPPGTVLSVTDFDTLPQTDIRIERVDGTVFYPNLNEVTMSPTPRSIHQRLVARLLVLLDALDGEVIPSPMDLHLPGGVRVQPDLFWIADGSACVDRDTHFEGPPDLVIEVLSPSTARHDKTTKFLLYEQHGVREYWIVNPDHHQIEVWTLKDGQFALQGTFNAAQTFDSAVLHDAQIDLSRVFVD